MQGPPGNLAAAFESASGSGGRGVHLTDVVQLADRVSVALHGPFALHVFPRLPTSLLHGPTFAFQEGGRAERSMGSSFRAHGQEFAAPISCSKEA